MNIETVSKKGALAAIIGLSMLVGATGGTILKAGAANAQTTTPAVTSTATQGTTSSTAESNSQGSTVQSNENSAHEAEESAAWEAAENAGKQPWTNPGAYGGNPHTQSGSTTQ